MKTLAKKQIERINMINNSLSFDVIYKKGDMRNEERGRIASKVHPETLIVGIDMLYGMPPLLSHIDDIYVINRD